MSDQYNVGFSQDYTSEVRLLLQQQQSRLRGAVRVKSFQGKGAKAVEQIGSVTAVKRTTRHADTPRVDTPHDARWVFPSDYEWSDLIDEQDELRSIADFESPYVQNGAAAINRGIETEIFNAFFSDTTKTGEDGSTTTDWTTFVAANAAHQLSTAALTAARIKSGLKALRAANVDFMTDRIYMAVSAEEIEDLQLEDQYINWDYTSNRAMEGTDIKPFLGVNFIHSELIPLNGAGKRRCPMWAESGMCLGIWGDVTGRVSERGDKSYATQVYAKATIGATRVEEKKIVEIIGA